MVSVPEKSGRRTGTEPRRDRTESERISPVSTGSEEKNDSSLIPTPVSSCR